MTNSTLIEGAIRLNPTTSSNPVTIHSLKPSTTTRNEKRALKTATSSAQPNHSFRRCGAVPPRRPQDRHRHWEIGLCRAMPPKTFLAVDHSVFKDPCSTSSPRTKDRTSYAAVSPPEREIDPWWRSRLTSPRAAVTKPPPYIYKKENQI